MKLLHFRVKILIIDVTVLSNPVCVSVSVVIFSSYLDVFVSFFFSFLSLISFSFSSLSSFSESKPCVEGAGFLSSSFRSHLVASALLRCQSDPHLFGFPDLHFPLGPTAALVHSLESTDRVRHAPLALQAE